MSGPFTTIEVAEWNALQERIRKLEAVAKAAEKRLDVWTSESYAELRDALASLKADVDVK